MNTTSATHSIPAAWHVDPTQRHQLRYWDGIQWTQHVSTGGRSTLDPLVAATPATGVSGGTSVDRGAAGVVPAHCTGRRQFGTLKWLGICGAVGGLGMLLVDAGTETTTTVFGTERVDYSGTGLFGMSLFCIAVAMFFGRGTFRSLGRVARGQGGLGDVIFVGSDVRAALITLGAIAAAVVLAGMAVVG